MEYVIKNHNTCIACSEKGFLFRGFDYVDDHSSIQARLSFLDHTEGWVGIPHGGIGMGAVMELAEGLRNYPDNTSEVYPVQIGFRMGGQKVKLGDEAIVKVSETEGGAEGRIFVEADRHPYLKVCISYNAILDKGNAGITEWLPGTLKDLEPNIMPLPRYKDCFVCGYERKYPGLDREFFLQNHSISKIVYSKAGFNPRDKETFYWFKKNGSIHPVALLALLDETMGWAGFFISGHGGVTVKLNTVFLREIGTGEKLLVLGRPEKKSGKNPKLMFFWSTGGIASVSDDGSLEVVAVSDAQYLVQPELTDQMKEYLHPEKLTKKLFSMV